MRRIIAIVSATIFTLSLCACGTILYPERKGQKNGQLDPAVVVLDAVGLLFFFVPGVIAFAADFVTGTIYLPNSRSEITDPDEAKAVVVNGPMTRENIQAAIEAELGHPVDLDHSFVYTIPASAAQAEKFRHLKNIH